MGIHQLMKNVGLRFGADNAVGENSGTPTSTTILGRLKAIADAITARFSVLGQQTMANSTSIVVASNQSAIPVSQNGTWTVGRTWSLSSGTDSITAVQSGTWAVNQTQISGTAITLGQKAMAASYPVVIASDQPPLDTYPDWTVNRTIIHRRGAITQASLTEAVLSNATAVPGGESAQAINYTTPASGPIFYLTRITVATLAQSLNNVCSVTIRDGAGGTRTQAVSIHTEYEAMAHAEFNPPIPMPANTAIQVLVDQSTTTSTTYRISFGGYEQ